MDYGSGNVGSVKNLLLAMNVEVVVSNQPSEIQSASHLVLPGVGAFAYAMENIHKRIPLDILQNELFKNNKPFLGICVGFQVMAEKGLEFGEHEGLGWIQGTVSRLNSGSLPLPHMGWNNIIPQSPSEILRGLVTDIDFYFANSFSLKGADPAQVVAMTEYGEYFPSIVQKQNLFGVQFHPEKSQRAGRYIFENFLNYS